MPLPSPLLKEWTSKLLLNRITRLKFKVLGWSIWLAALSHMSLSQLFKEGKRTYFTAFSSVWEVESCFTKAHTPLREATSNLDENSSEIIQIKWEERQKERRIDKWKDKRGTYIYMHIYIYLYIHSKHERSNLVPVHHLLAVWPCLNLLCLRFLINKIWIIREPIPWEYFQD